MSPRTASTDHHASVKKKLNGSSDPEGLANGHHEDHSEDDDQRRLRKRRLPPARHEEEESASDEDDAMDGRRRSSRVRKSSYACLDSEYMTHDDVIRGRQEVEHVFL
jgi:hypothetical protein